MWEFIKKILVIIAIVLLVILVIWGVIRIAPSIFSSLASVSVAVSSIFKPKATPTPALTLPSPTPLVIVTTPTPTPDYIEPTATPGYTTQPTPTPTVIHTQTGKPDLAIQIESVGVIDRNSNIFVPRSSIDASERAGIRFAVVNLGGRNSGTWTWNALMPVATANSVYSSAPQRSLAPGERIEFTMGFDGIRSGGSQNAVISVDEQNFISETREDNNSAIVYFNVSGNYSGNGSYSGTRPDLAVRVAGIGVINDYNGAFIPTGQIYANQKAAVQFEVRNSGGQSTGTWTFSADLPTNSDSTYESGREPSLAPGESLILTIGFDDINTDDFDSRRGSYQVPVSITLDQDDRIDESNENNNDLSTEIPIIR